MRFKVVDFSSRYPAVEELDEDFGEPDRVERTY
jgi:hypothetical protein